MTTVRAISLLACLGLGGALCLAAADTQAEMTLSQFLALVGARSSGEKPAGSPAQGVHVSGAKADSVFHALLVAQGKEAAARQSLDRLSGWAKVVQARFEVQNAAALDVDMLRFAEARAAAQLARYEADRLQIAREANRLLGRAPESPLVAVIETPAPILAEKAAPAPDAPTPQSQSSPPAVSIPAQPNRPAHLAKLEEGLLPQAQELLATMYRSYLFGGTPLSTLLWQEQEVFQTELQYRLALAEAAMGPLSPASNP